MGNINVFYGPMKSGKTQKILSEFQNQVELGKNVKLFKPSIDIRFDVNKVVSRTGNSADAITINTIDDLTNYDADIFFIDEFQFLDGNIDIIKDLADNGKKFFIAGLDLTSDKKDFGQMGSLMQFADYTEQIQCKCEICKNNNAIYSFFNGKKDSDIVIGDEQYIPVCEHCYNILKQKQF